MPEKTMVFTPHEAEKVLKNFLTDVYEFTVPAFKEGDICQCVTETDIIPFAFVKVLVIHRHNFNQILHFDAVAAGYQTLEEFKKSLVRKTTANISDDTKVWHIIFELASIT